VSWETGSERIQELIDAGELGAIRVAREVNDAAGKVLESGILSPW
jgi:hypothetical protein